MPDGTKVTIKPPQGRSLLKWAGKRRLRSIAAPPAQLIETFAPAPYPSSLIPHPSSLFHGDNKAVLAHLLANGLRGKVQLIYIDPPYHSGMNYTRKVTLRGGTRNSKGTVLCEQVQYADSWTDEEYLQFMYERLLLLRELLRPTGVLYLHCDHRKEHHLRLLLDEVFGVDNYLNTISWRSQTPRGAKVDAFYYPFSTHYIHIYAKDKTAPPTWRPQRKQIVISEEEAERDYYKDEKGYFRTSDPGTYSFEALLRLYREGRIYVTKGGEVVIDEKTKTFRTTKGTIGIKYYLKPNGKGGYIAERAIDNLWDDVPGLGTTPGEDTGYPTQKTEALLKRIICASSDPGDIVLDCFIGSGTIAAVAQKLGRRWIGCDVSKGAIQTTSKRLQAIVLKQLETADEQAQKRLTPFAVYRVGADVQNDDAHHQPPHAKVDIKRVKDRLIVEIQDFVSSTMLNRLRQQDGSLQIDDWRAMVDSVMIDPTYDGKVFNICLSDVPERKTDLVAGKYELSAPKGKTTVAVKIVDLLGEEVLETRQL